MGCKSSRQPPVPEGQCPYEVGKRYKVARPLELFSSQNAEATRIETLKAKKDIVLLVEICESAGRRKGFVIPQPAETRDAGWVSLEDVHRGKAVQPPLQRTALPGSWDLKARYCVHNPATLRAGPALDSEWIGELNAGCEVLLLDFSVTTGSSSADIGKVRLRSLVFAGDKIGWMSPETGVGDHLLKPVNLLSRKVVDIHNRSLKNSGTGLRKSYQPGGNSPWEAGSTYRMLERAPMRLAADLTSSEAGKVSAGSLVEVQEMNNVEIQGGWCPVASIMVLEGAEKGKTGWVRCTAKDGHDVMDTRDHNEYEKILRKMRENIPPGELAADARPAEIQAKNVKLEQQRKEDQARAEEEKAKITPPEDTDTPILEEQEAPAEPQKSQERTSSADLIAAEFAELTETMRKLEDFEQRQDDRAPPEPRLDLERTSNDACFWCSCGK